MSTERRAQVNYDRNVRPLIVKRDIDFSENGSIKNKRQIQSQYWVTIGYTLFVSIASWIEAAEWDKESGLLPIGSEVTVYGEKSGEKINNNSFWATVTKLRDADNEMYEVKDEHGVSHTIHRRFFRHRKRHSIASGHVSDDKVHDRHAMQHFTDHELVYLEGYMKENFPADIPLGHITRLHQHSNNAGQHFKNTGAINYYTTLIDSRGGPSETAFLYSFGAPGHVRGPYDGIGGRWKNKIDQCMSTAEVGLLEFTASGSIQNVEDVHSALEYYFGRSTGKYAQLAGKNPIHHYHFFCYTAEKHPINRPDESFVTLQGISKHYQFLVKREGVVYMRQRSCFCLSCMAELTEGTLTWESMHNVKGCSAKVRSETDSDMYSDTNIYCFDKCDCTKTAGPGVMATVQCKNKSRREFASKLTVGDWVMFDAEDDEAEPVWLGRVMSNPVWDGQGVLENKTPQIISYGNGVKIGKGEVALFVMWYEKIDVMSDKLEYWVSRTETKPIVQSNKYLIPLDVHMHQMRGDNNNVPKLRTSSRTENAQSNANSSRRIDDWHDNEFGIVWNMHALLRRAALSMCND